MQSPNHEFSILKTKLKLHSLRYYNYCSSSRQWYWKQLGMFTLESIKAQFKGFKVSDINVERNREKGLTSKRSDRHKNTVNSII